MENSVALIKPKLTSTEKKIIAMVIDGLPSENSRRAYRRHLEEFFVWHAGEKRPELNKALIQRYVKSLRAKKLSSSTINQKLSSIRKLATEAEDNNLIDSRIANEVRAVKGVPFRGRHTGNWLSREEAIFRLESLLRFFVYSLYFEVDCFLTKQGRLSCPFQRCRKKLSHEILPH